MRFPADCPITPLGVDHLPNGTIVCYYLTSKMTIVRLPASNHSKVKLIALFGLFHDWLQYQWPLYGRPAKSWNWFKRRTPPPVVGFDQVAASRALIAECCRKGRFIPFASTVRDVQP